MLLQGCGTNKQVLELNQAGAEIADSYKEQWSAFETAQADLTKRRREALIDASQNVATAQARSKDIDSVLEISGRRTEQKHYADLARILDQRLKSYKEIAALPVSMNKNFSEKLGDTGSPSSKVGEMQKGLLELHKDKFEHSNFDNFKAFAEGVSDEIGTLKKAADEATK